MPRRSKAAADAPAIDLSLRLFFALWPSPGARDALAMLAREVSVETQGRAPATANLHLTLAFIGSAPATRVGALQAAGQRAVMGVSPFTLTLDRIGAFRRAGVAWIGASMIPPQLDHLVRQLSDALAAQGFASERRAFEAHVTLARHCLRMTGPRVPEPISWTPARLTLVASDLSPEGPRYRELAGWALTGLPDNPQAAGIV